MRPLFFAPLSVHALRASAALALAPLTLLAQALPAGGDAANPEAFVPPIAYRSVFADTPAGVEGARVPWRLANDTVGQFERGHMDVVKWEASNPGLSAPAPPPSAATQGAPASAAPKPAGGIAPAMPGHMHQRGQK